MSEKVKRKNRKYTYEEIYEIFKNKGYKLLDKEYISNRTKMSYEDRNGYRYETTLENVHKAHSMATKSNKWTLYNIQRYLETNGETCVLKSTEFINQNAPLDWVCENGHEFHTNWNGFYTKGSRCGECAKITRMYTFEQCADMVSKRQDYKLLDMERRKNTVGTDIIYYYMEHNCGRRYWVYKQEFDSGKGCKPCADKIRGVERRDSEDSIKEKVEDGTDFEYRYLESKFVKQNYKARRKIKVRHEECGKEYWVEYSAWNSGSRCGDCYPIERYAVPYEEWQDRVNNKNIHDLELLDVYYKNNNSKNRNEAWLKIKCKNCGNEIDRVGGGWKSGCPNCTISKGEDMVRKLLNEYNVKHTQQIKYDGLLGVGGGNLSYDFYLDEYNLLIEYQGEFHDGSARMPDKSYLPTQQEHDRRKREYAEQQGIDLLEIWYWDFDNIEDILKEKLQLDGGFK